VSGLTGPPDLLLAALHWLEYLGLLGGIGSFVVRRMGRITPRIRWADPPMHLAFAAALTGGFLLLLFIPTWLGGVRVAAEALALVLCLRGKMLVAVPAVFAAAILPLTSHAAILPLPAGAEFADAVHVLSAGMWAGGILALATLRPPGGWGSAEARDLVARFGRVALIAFGITALTGVLRATEQLAALDDLWLTPYGVVLSVKSVGILVMVVLSTIAWRRGTPLAGFEAGVAVLVVGATALLAAFPFTGIG
jgi:putative copper export protein